MVDLNTAKAAASADVQKVETEIGFVRANWKSLSLVIILAALVGIAIGKFLL